MSTEAKFGFQGWTPDRLGCLAGKTYVITGANAGAGFEAARAFLDKDAAVVMLNRSVDKSSAAIATLKHNLKVPVAGHPNRQVRARRADGQKLVDRLLCFGR